MNHDYSTACMTNLLRHDERVDKADELINGDATGSLRDGLRSCLECLPCLLKH